MKTRVILLLTICLSVIAIDAQTTDLKVPAEVKPFVESETKPIALESADLNGDGLKDYILVLERENPAETDEFDFPKNQRSLLILVRGKDKKLTQVKRNENIIMCSQCGGVWGDPFAGITVGKNTFTVNHYGGSNWRWTADYKFDYSRIDKTWQLVKIEKDSFHTSEPNKSERKVMTPPKDFGKVDVADFDPDDYEEKPDDAEPVGEAKSSISIDVSDFNKKIAKASAANEIWVRFPTQVLAKWLPQFEEFGSRNIEMRSEFADATDFLKVTVIDDNYADDSVRGEKYMVELAKDGQGVWKIVSAGKSWVCQQNRGHQDYSIEPCL